MDSRLLLPLIFVALLGTLSERVFAQSAATSPVAHSSSPIPLKPSPAVSHGIYGVFLSPATQSVISLIQTVVAFFNVLLIYWIFRESARSRDNERRQDADERRARLKLETKSFWIQSLIMEPANGKLHEFFNKWYGVIDGPRPSPTSDPRAGARIQLGEFSKDLRDIRARVEEPLALVSPDFAPIQDILNDLQDVVTDQIQSRHLGVEHSGSISNPRDEFRRLRRIFFAKIYEIHSKITNL